MSGAMLAMSKMCTESDRGRISGEGTHETIQLSVASGLNSIGAPSSPTGGPISNAESTEAQRMKSVDSAKNRPGHSLDMKTKAWLVCAGNDEATRCLTYGQTRTSHV